MVNHVFPYTNANFGGIQSIFRDSRRSSSRFPIQLQVGVGYDMIQPNCFERPEPKHQNSYLQLPRPSICTHKLAFHPIVLVHLPFFLWYFEGLGSDCVTNICCASFGQTSGPVGPQPQLAARDTSTLWTSFTSCRLSRCAGGMCWSRRQGVKTSRPEASTETSVRRL